jgi:hypothetical protein
MRRLVIRPLLVALCWAVLVPAFTWGAPGQDVDSVRGAKGSIRSKDELVSLVSHAAHVTRSFTPVRMEADLIP